MATVTVGQGFVAVPGRCMIDGFVIDATERERHSFPARVTRYPVESGSNVNDNIITDPHSITLDCTVSDTPIGEMVTVRQQSIGSGQGVSDGVPSNACYAHLLAVRKSGEPVTVVTSRGTYPAMAVDDIDVTSTAKDGGALKFTVKFSEINYVTTQRSTVATPGAQGLSARGHQPSKPADKPIISNGIVFVQSSSGYWIPVSDQTVQGITGTDTQTLQSSQQTVDALNAMGVGDLPLAPTSAFDQNGNIVSR